MIGCERATCESPGELSWSVAHDIGGRSATKAVLVGGAAAVSDAANPRRRRMGCPPPLPPPTLP